MAYTEKAWNDMENHYMEALEKERSKLEKTNDSLIQLSRELVQKNKEIERLNYFVEVLANILCAANEVIKTLREKEKA